MNKKVVTFLSLFSLVLILSIYYVISPFGNNIDPNNGLNVNVQVNNENDEYFASLEVAKEDNYQEYIDEMNAIIASSECTNEQKKEALENIEKRKSQKELENKTTAELKEIGYSKVFLEVSKCDIFVVINYPEFSNKDAAKIMSTIFKNFGTNYKIEIALKS